jgi:hypothetical protein
MPALDTTAATQAKSLLNGIDYGAVIGAPLKAAIDAQAMAARSTADFILDVGFDPKTKQPYNVDFVYIQDGKQVKMTVPLLAIIPIPALEITEVDIAFKASINASASQASSQSTSSATSGKITGKGSVGYGPFSLSVSVSASVSSKSDSKASQDSRYSVEYTQQIGVTARQADMPAGLATVLNILTTAATGNPVDGQVRVSPELGTINLDVPGGSQQSILVTPRGSNGLNAKPGTPVTITLQTENQTDAVRTVLALRGRVEAGGGGGGGGASDYLDAVMLGEGPLAINQVALSDLTNGGQAFKTNKNGELDLTMLIDPKKADPSMSFQPVQLTFAAKVDDKDETTTIPIRFLGTYTPPPAPPGPELDPSKTTITLPKQGSAKPTFTITALKADGSPAADVTLTATSSKPSAIEATVQGTGSKTGTDGTATIQVAWKNGTVPSSPPASATVTVTGSIDGTSETATVTVNVGTTALAAAAPRGFLIAEAGEEAEAPRGSGSSSAGGPSQSSRTASGDGEEA